MTEFAEDEREATLRLLATQPDGDVLAVMLGLVDPAPVVDPERKERPYLRKMWCDIHHVARVPLPWNPTGTRCMACYREKSRKRYYKETERPVPDKVRQYNRKAKDV